MHIAQFNYTGSWGNTSMLPDFSYQQRYAHHFHPSLGDPNAWLTQPLSQFSTPLSLSLSMGDACLCPPSLGDAGFFHPPRVTHVYIHPPRVTHMFGLRNPWWPPGVYGHVGIMAMASPQVSNTPMNRCPSGLHASFLRVPQLMPITVSCQSEGLISCNFLLHLSQRKMHKILRLCWCKPLPCRRKREFLFENVEYFSAAWCS